MADQSYRVNGGHTSLKDGEYREDGEAYEPNDRELELFPTKFEIVAGNAVSQSDGDAPSSDEDGGEEGAADFVEGSASAVATAIAEGEADGHLKEVREAEGERDGATDRKTVHNALDERAEETGEDAGDRPDGE